MWCILDLCGRQTKVIVPMHSYFLSNFVQYQPWYSSNIAYGVENGKQCQFAWKKQKYWSQDWWEKSECEADRKSLDTSLPAHGIIVHNLKIKTYPK